MFSNHPTVEQQLVNVSVCNQNVVSRICVGFNLLLHFIDLGFGGAGGVALHKRHASLALFDSVVTSLVRFALNHSVVGQYTLPLISARHSQSPISYILQ